MGVARNAGLNIPPCEGGERARPDGPVVFLVSIQASRIAGVGIEAEGGVVRQRPKMPFQTSITSKSHPDIPGINQRRH